MTATGLTLSDVPWEVTQVADWLTEGKPELGWRGDMRLELHIGVVQAAQTGLYRGIWRRKGEVIGRNLQVMRHNEDGTYKPILSRRVEAWHEIIPALVQIDPRTPGHVGTMERVEKANEIEHKHAADAIRDAKGEMAEHMLALVQEHVGGRLTHRQVGGSDERVDRNLAKD